MIQIQVIDASPLIILGKAGLLKTLSPLAERWIVPETVMREVAKKSIVESLLLQLADQAKVESRQAQAANPLVTVWNLDAGETEVITLALEQENRGVVLDDLQARKCATVLDIALIGSLGLVLRAKKEGLIDTAKPMIDTLIQSGLYIEQKLIDKILGSVGE